MKTFKQYINEGTTATITALKSDGKYYTSFLQYDGLSSGKEIIKHYNDEKGADSLTTKTGELRSIYDGKIEYYTDRKILDIASDEETAVDNANQAGYKYFFDGKKWLFAKNSIHSFSDMKKLK